VVAVTGARGFRRGEEQYAGSIILAGLKNLQFNVTEFVSGACWGVDTLAARDALALWPHARHRLVVPNAPHNEELVAEFEVLERLRLENAAGRGREIHATVEKMPAGTGYMERNDRLVLLADVLLAFPSTRDEVVRSGTWATVRRARKANVPVMVYPLDGSKPWMESDGLTTKHVGGLK
jgi:hypothetical protein